MWYLDGQGHTDPLLFYRISRYDNTGRYLTMTSTLESSSSFGMQAYGLTIDDLNTDDSKQVGTYPPLSSPSLFLSLPLHLSLSHFCSLLQSLAVPA